VQPIAVGEALDCFRIIVEECVEKVLAQTPEDDRATFGIDKNRNLLRVFSRPW
jgi:hypothetical protein